MTSSSVPFFEFIQLPLLIKEEPDEEPIEVPNDSKEDVPVTIENHESGDVFLVSTIDVFKTEAEEDVSMEDVDKDIQVINNPIDIEDHISQQSIISIQISDSEHSDDTKLYNRKNLKIRGKNHGKTLYCSYCNKAFPSSKHAMLDLHVRRIHTKIKSFECNSELGCDKKFYTKAELQLHIKRYHNPFECRVCSETFMLLKDLDQHLDSHINPKENQCELCCKQFARALNYNQHKETHKNDVLVFFPCKICKATFSKKRDLWKHVRENHQSEHICETCGDIFKKVEELRTHCRTVHAIENKHICPICPNKTFWLNAQLRRHLRDSHPGEELPVNTTPRVKVNKYVAMLRETTKDQHLDIKNENNA